MRSHEDLDTNSFKEKIKIAKEPPRTHCPVCGHKFVEIYHDGVHPVVPPDKMYEGLVDGEDWYLVETIF